MVLSKLTLLGRPASLGYSRARASALAVGASGVVWTFSSHLSFLFFLPLSISLRDDPTETEIMSQRVVKSIQSANVNNLCI